jgi:predicted RND superfamily exporter protein
MPSAPRPRWNAWLQRLVDYRWLLAGVALALGIAGAWAGQRLALDRSIENMFAPDDPILADYRQLQRTFGRHDIVLAVYSDPKLTTPEGIARVEALRDELRKVPGVVAVVSLADLPAGTSFEGSDVGDKIREVFSGYTHNKELTAAGVLCLTERPAPGKPSRREILRGMRAVITKHPDGALVGEPVLIEEAFDLLDSDGKRLTWWSTGLVMLVIVACFRSLRWLVLPLAVVQLSLHATKGLLVVSGLQLSMVSSMLAAIITVCGVAMVVHVMVHYLDIRRRGVDRRAALVQTMDELAVPITYAILTDAAGFAALMVSRVGPIHDFGLMMAIGAMMTLPACMLLMPSLILVGDSSKLPPPEKHGHLTAVLMRMLSWSNTHAGTLAVAATVITIVALLGSRRLERETAFTENFREGIPILRAYDFVEDEFGGAGVWDLMIPADGGREKDTSGSGRAGSLASTTLPAPTTDAEGEPLPPRPPDPAMLAAVIELEQELIAQSNGQLKKAISLGDTLVAMPMVGSAKALAGMRPMAINIAMGAMRTKMPEFVDSMYAVDPETGRTWIHVLLRAPERLGAEEKLALIEQVETTAQKRFPGSFATGYYVLLADLIESVLDDQWVTFGVASLAVLAMTLLAFRNVPLALATMIPNAIPVLVLFGAMGWLGIKTNMGAAMIAAVSVGLSIDSSIHYVMLYQHHRRRGLTMDEALEQSQDSAGRAATLSTLALIVGFATLCVSDFIPTIYFGALVSLSMIGGLLGNILVQPMLIRKLDRG